MDKRIGSIVKNLSKYTIGETSNGDLNSRVIRRGRKKIAFFIHNKAMGYVVTSSRRNVLKKEGKGVYFPAIEVSPVLYRGVPYSYMPKINEAYNHCLATINGNKDLILLAEQIDMVKVPNKGNLKRVVHDVKKGKASIKSGHLEYLLLIEETHLSNEAIKLILNESQSFINLNFFEVLFKSHASDHAKIFPMAQMLKRLISQVEDSFLLDEIYEAGVLAYENSLTWKLDKVNALHSFILNNECTSQQTIENIAMSDELSLSVRAFALEKLRKFESYSDYSKLWMEKLFNLA